MADINFLNQSLTTINIQITPIFLAKAAGGTVFTGVIIKLFLDGKFWQMLAGIWGFANRKYAESSINKSLKKIKKNPAFSNFEDGLAKKVKFDIQSNLHLNDIAEGETVLIALNSAKCSPSNLTNATLQYVSKSLLPKAAMTLDPHLEKGVIYVVCREAFVSQKMISARDYFDSKILPEEYSKNPTFEKLMESLRNVQRFGLLTRVILQQFIELNRRDFETFEHSKIKEETSQFVDFVRDITEREENENSKLKFEGSFIKVRFILVSSSYQLKMGGVNHLLNRIKAQHDFEYIYLICPAINKHLTAKRGQNKKDDFWQVYNETLKRLEKEDFRYTAKKSQLVKTKNKKGDLVEIGVSFLTRNY